MPLARRVSGVVRRRPLQCPQRHRPADDPARRGVRRDAPWPTCRRTSPCTASWRSRPSSWIGSWTTRCCRGAATTAFAAWRATLKIGLTIDRRPMRPSARAAGRPGRSSRRRLRLCRGRRARAPPPSRRAARPCIRPPNRGTRIGSRAARLQRGSRAGDRRRPLSESRRPRTRYLRQYCRAIVVLDKDGCGRENAPREDIQQEIERDLAVNGWNDRAKAIVIDPELEAWVWSGSSNVAKVLGWSKEYEDLKAWLVDRDLWSANSAKPSDPKAAMKAALREANRASSAALFGQMAQRVTLRRCQCPAFAELKRTLQHWFGEEAV